MGGIKMTAMPAAALEQKKPVVSRSDAAALGVLTALLALALGNRFYFDGWLARYDVFTAYLPWYYHLGERLRDFDVPGWNPYLFSGMPFAGDPQSGWMYFPAMLAFTLFPVLTAFKVMVGIQLAVAAFSTYAYARVLGMGPVAALTSAVIFAFGPLLQWNTYCCLVFGQLVVWIPLALLGVELALRTRGWRNQLAPWCVTGFAVSQMFAAWVGEGWIYIPLLIGGYTAYRGLLSPSDTNLGWNDRLKSALATAAAGLGTGVFLGAAGIWPRLAANAESNLRGGRYDQVGGESVANPPWDLDHLLVQIAGSGYSSRQAALGGVAIVLALLAPLLARKRFAVPFFLPLTIIALILAMDRTPLHSLFYLIPNYREIHEHDPWRTVSLAAIGPALLSGATVETLFNRRGKRRLLPIAAIPLLLLATIAAVVSDAGAWIGWPPLVAAALATALIGFVLLMPSQSGLFASKQLRVLVPSLLILVAFVQPTGLELTASWLRWPKDTSWERHWRPDPVVREVLQNEVSEIDAGGAGGFLAEQLATNGTFRYVGYGGFGFPGDAQRLPTYMSRRFESTVQAILVNGRPMFLELYDIQGYNPLQLARYAEFVTALNGEGQDYHLAYLLPTGVRSPLLDLLAVRYVLVDATIPPEREDIVGLTAGRREIFRTPSVVVFERVSPPPYTWIVHDVRTVKQGEALPLLADGDLNPYETALVEAPWPVEELGDPSTGESARVTRYEPDAITIETTAKRAGLLVVSEVYEKGWRAYVDGERENVLPTDHALRGVPIPAGEHTVEMRYEPLSLRVGLPISVVTAVAMLAIFAAAGWSRLRFHRRRAPLSLGRRSS